MPCSRRPRCWDTHVHVVVHLFAYTIIDESGFGKGIETDSEQVALGWIPLEELLNMIFIEKL
ncbi:hypothetical protein NDK43_23355 [Neobacillus pocheonensis]|uniref:Nudix hydrolase domain-containing protein n=1 Tax=Neobacillus pocheonensis TaxID=363869 RepID=A0ABT0WGL0_9BACI|nr:MULTISPECIES: hypothetical protein [unclassified Bacillus (in: firmicutes)]MCM2534745.1 hypothetical protein [Neobacillus pocheonensis]